MGKGGLENRTGYFSAVLHALESDYSVTGQERVNFYQEQMKQYPLYPVLFERISSEIDKVIEREGGRGGLVDIIEYGPGTGDLAVMIAKKDGVGTYTVVEPDPSFLELCERKASEHHLSNMKFVCKKAEEYISDREVEAVLHTFAFHHFDNKEEALKMIYNNLRKGGLHVIGDVFIPDYDFNKDYQPSDIGKFAESVLGCAAEHILAMPSPEEKNVADQIKTAIMDLFRYEEFKVSKEIAGKMLEDAGFKGIEFELLKGKNQRVNYKRMGWYLSISHK
ncbi:class I SAM-dependent methyltransferase [Candidatus Woesearchaeota archaeon]|nr:MAG: class I SAM-dependent methyltransferase [Candidatus Woesearchaeota archaeon]